MSIEYKEDEILNIENMRNGKPLIGYINPSGQILDFSMLLGHYGHDNWCNPSTPYFLAFVSFVIKNYKISEFFEYEWDKEKIFYKNNLYDGYDDVVKRGVEYAKDENEDTYDNFIEKLNNYIAFQRERSIRRFKSHRDYTDDEYETLNNDLMKFFQKAYSNKDFFGSLGRTLFVEKRDKVFEKYNIDENTFFDNGDEFYYDYLTVQLMSYFKDICVQYLGYDSIERAWPIGDVNIYNNIYEESNGYILSDNPRIIVSSQKNINDRFYNWLLMDWTVQQVPKKIWDENRKKFIDENYIFDYVHREKEEILGKEIESIKRLVKKEDRYKYFR